MLYKPFWIWLLQFFQDPLATGNPFSGRLQKLRLKSCWQQQCEMNWRTEDLLGFSAFWYHVEGKQLDLQIKWRGIMQTSCFCQVSHADWKEPCSGIQAPFLLNSMHLDMKVERACTTLICHLQNGIASCCTSSWHQSCILVESLHALPS